MTERAVGRSALQSRIRVALILGYLAFVIAGFVSPWQPRVFWTMLLPLVPMAIVLMGFANWRQICPLAAFGEIGTGLNRGEQRRAPEWMERWFFVVTFAFLLAMLVMRLVATNGDGVWLSALLVGLALAAIAVNWLLTGKSWCNFICPVGLVERIYTEPNSLPRNPGNSQCTRCTACKKYCPDIDQENGYWRDIGSGSRRVAIYAFPGLVLAFYCYYWLRHGDWAAYFDGRWTRHPVDADLVVGPGFFFAPGIPAVIAAILTLLAFSLLSYGVFVAVEAGVGRFVEDAERRRHLTLGLAAFTAFNVFYVFAGAPTLRRLPGGLRLVAFLAPLVATLFLVERWGRRRVHYIRDKSAAKLLRNWPFDEAPPDDPAEVYARIKAGEHAKEEHVAAYSNTVREMIADGLVRSGEMRLLEEVRHQLGISTREHERILAQLSEEERELFVREPSSIERRAQLDGYQTALTEALLRHAPEHEIDELRTAFGVCQEDHDKLLGRIRRESGPLLERAMAQLDHARSLHTDIVRLSASSSGPCNLLAYLLRSLMGASIERVVEFLEIAGGRAEVRAAREGLLSGESDKCRAALERLREAVPAQRDLIDQLEPVLIGDAPGGLEDPAELRSLLERHVASADPYVRAAALWAAATALGVAAGPLVADGLKDSYEIVRQTAVHAARRLLEAVEAAAGTQAQPEGGSDLSPLLGALAADDEQSFESMAPIERMQYLRGVPMLADLDPEDLYDVSLLAVEETIEPPAVVCREGDDATDLYVLVDGEVSVSVHPMEDGEAAEVELAVLGVGEVIGELSLLDGGPRSATVRPTGGPIRVLRIPGASFRSQLLHRSRVTRPLLTGMARHIRRLSALAARSDRS